MSVSDLLHHFRKGCLAAFLVLAGCNSAPPTPQHVLLEQSSTKLEANRRVLIRVEAAEPVLFLGQLAERDDGLIGSSVLYPGDNAAVFLAAVLTHAAVNSSAQAAKEAQEQEAANLVLQPYQPMLEEFDHETLVANGLARLPAPLQRTLHFSLATDAGVQPDWVVESAPAFILASDRSALKLRHAIIARAADDPDTIHYQNVVEVISRRAPEQATEQYWTESARILETSARLYATSLELAYMDMAKQLSTAEAPERTFLYQFGPRKLYKRSRVALDDCERYTIRSLRGWLISSPDLGVNGCTSTATADTQAMQ